MFTINEIKTACKSHNIDPKDLLLTLKANKQTKEPREFWDCFLKVWFDTYLSLKKEDYQKIPGDEKSIADLYDILKKRAIKAGYEWTCDVGCNGFEMYIRKAEKHSSFLKTDFRPINILRQFNSIVSNVTGTTKTVNGDYKRELLDRIGANSG